MVDMDIMQLMEKYNTDDACRDVLEKLRWPDGTTCPRCQSKSIRNSHTRHQYDCGSCGYQFSVMSGTIFHDTHLPLRKWFVAIYLMVESKKGMSANQMKRTLHVSYKTAWYLCHRIRAAMTEVNPRRLSGTVEADETFIGGKARNMHKAKRERVIQGRGGSGKVAVIGMLQRHNEGGDTSTVRASVIPDISRKTIPDAVRKDVEQHSELITDALAPYNDLNAEYVHEVIDHAEAYVKGEVHTNGIENFWSLFKRSLIGSYHKMSEKHLDAYLDELEWRFNNRDNDYLFRDTLVKLINSENLPYAELTH